MALDHYRHFPADITQPATDAAVVTPSDTEDLVAVPRALVVNGPVKVTTRDGTTLVLPDLGNWQWDLRVSRVFATGGTTATSIVALY